MIIILGLSLIVQDDGLLMIRDTTRVCIAYAYGCFTIEEGLHAAVLPTMI